jgi:hypothetical protein
MCFVSRKGGEERRRGKAERTALESSCEGSCEGPRPRSHDRAHVRDRAQERPRPRSKRDHAHDHARGVSNAYRHHAPRGITLRDTGGTARMCVDKQSMHLNNFVHRFREGGREGGREVNSCAGAGGVIRALSESFTGKMRKRNVLIDQVWFSVLHICIHTYVHTYIHTYI